MKINRYLLLILCFLGLTRFSVAGETPRIFHIPPESLSQTSPVEITCVVAPGDCHLQAVKIFLRIDPAALYKEFAMHYRDGLWYLPLIQEMVQGDSLYYFITAEFTDFAAVAFPSEKPTENPIRVPLIRPIVKKK